MNKPFYITTTLPYVNSDPHIGFAMEIIRADVIARYKKSLGHPVFFNTGTDEHGQKIYQKATEAGVEVQAYVDEYAEKFKGLGALLGLSSDINFIRTTDKHHVKAAQKFWKVCDQNGYIEKKKYQTKYCVGCELEKTDSELDDKGRCPVHPDRDLELRDEENYFFKFSQFQEKLLALYSGRPDFVVPDFRFNEIKSFVERGLEDFSISRLSEKMPWGVPVPGDETQVMYVWFDALVNYISAVGWPENMEQFTTWWVESGGVVQYCGKDNTRQQSAMWQAMLLAADLPPSRQIVVNGFINSGGQKMSKSLGNVVSPYDLVTEYGTDALRYYVTRELSSFEDSDYTAEKFKQVYNANLANGLGNLVSRVLAMAHGSFAGTVRAHPDISVPIMKTIEGVASSQYIEGMAVGDYIATSIVPKYTEAIESYELHKAADALFDLIGELDRYIAHYEPYKLVKTDQAKAEAILHTLLASLSQLTRLLAPFLPASAGAMEKALGVVAGETPEVFNVTKLSASLFPRKE